MTKATFIPKTRNGGLYTCYITFKDKFADKTMPGEIYKLAKKCEYTSGKVSYIMIAKKNEIPAVMIEETKFANHFVPFTEAHVD